MKKSRIESIDFARGFTMLMMIMVDNQGAPRANDIHFAFRETQWKGLSPADLVFPSFLFIAGLVIPISTNKHRFQVTRDVLVHVVARGIKLFGIGVFLNLWAGDFNFYQLVIMGVLQRIAICYVVLTLLYLHVDTIYVRLAVTLIFGTYLAIMYGLDVPHCGRGILSIECNAASYVDRTVFGEQHVPSSGVLPEGITSTLSSIVTTHCGLEFGQILFELRSKPKSLFGVWLLCSCLLLGIGYLLSEAVPINKKIWTASFTFIAAGYSGLSMCVWLSIVDIALPALSMLFYHDPLEQRQPLLSPKYVKAEPLPSRVATCIKQFLSPLKWLGRNPALVFIAMVALEILLMDTIHFYWWKDGNRHHSSAWSYAYENGFTSSHLSARVSSSLFAMTHVALWVIVAGILYYQKLFFTL